MYKEETGRANVIINVFSFQRNTECIGTVGIEQQTQTGIDIRVTREETHRTIQRKIVQPSSPRRYQEQRKQLARNRKGKTEEWRLLAHRPL
jgi:bifunctional ADP-heptose synthase (sugar kinase/adenylyltransferase)